MMACAKTQQSIFAFAISIAAVTVLLLIEASSLQRVGTNQANRYNLNFGLLDTDKNIQQRQRREAAVECSANYTINEKGGNLISPGYPKQYPESLHCQWRLTSSTSSNVILKFTDVSIEEAEDCRYDYLAVYNEADNMVEKLCGTHTNKLVIVNSTTAVILFHSDETYTAKGFSLEYFLEVASNCKSILNQSEGTVTSPLYPDNYPGSTDCHTTIIVEAGAKVNLKFDVLNLEFDENCDYDFVDIYDGETTESPLLGHFCSNPGDAVVTSTNNTMMVHFHSDALINYNGFSASYTSVPSEIDEIGDCIWEKGKNDGTITSPNFPGKYPSNSYCSIKIVAPEDGFISIFINDIGLEVDVNCTYDRLEIRDGLDEESPLLGFFCGRTDEEREITSTKNSVRITFHSDSFTEFYGFDIKYQIHEKEINVASPSPTTILSSQSFIEVPQNFTAVSGEPHIMSCKPKDSEVKVEWTKDGMDIDLFLNLDLHDNGKILWIHSMSEELKGTYTCKAITPDGDSYSVHAELDMKEKEEHCNIIFRHMPKNTSMLEGDTKLIECSLSSSKSGQITWLKNGLPLGNSKGYHQIPNGFLLITEATLEMSGIYTCVAEEKTGCVRQTSALIKVSPRINIMDICGRPVTGKPNKRKPQTDHARILGGKKSKKGAFPWQAKLINHRYRQSCGGTLLNEHWVITAAHCLYISKSNQLAEAKSFFVKLGEYNLYEEEPEEVVTGVEDYFIHPEFHKGTFNNDIAMVKLMDSIQFTDYVLPVCLGDHRFIRGVLLQKQLPMGTITGWGQLTENGGIPQFLQELRMPIVDWETCRQSTDYMVTTNMFCAGYAQEIIGDACQGDSGGPFVMEHDDVWYLVGIVSWGVGCGRQGQYGFYTKVDNYHSWIKAIVN